MKQLAGRLFAWGLCAVLPACAAETFRVGTYNLDRYTEAALEARGGKTEASRAHVRACIRALDADVLALQELSGTNAFLELRQALRAEGRDYPHAQFLAGPDTNAHLAVLSRFPILASRGRVEDSYLLMGRRHRVQRGFLEVSLQVNPRYQLTALVAHLKSRRQSVQADEAEMRLQEALLLRERITSLLNQNPDINLVVLGDFNDVKDSAPLRAILGRGRTALLDTRPGEANGDNHPPQAPRRDPARITWTHYYAKEDTYSRIDYILLSPGLAREWLREETRVLAAPNWGLASDHRPIVAAFAGEDR